MVDSNDSKFWINLLDIMKKKIERLYDKLIMSSILWMILHDGIVSYQSQWIRKTSKKNEKNENIRLSK